MRRISNAGAGGHLVGHQSFPSLGIVYVLRRLKRCTSGRSMNVVPAGSCKPAAGRAEMRVTERATADRVETVSQRVCRPSRCMWRRLRLHSSRSLDHR